MSVNDRVAGGTGTAAARRATSGDDQPACLQQGQQGLVFLCGAGEAGQAVGFGDLTVQCPVAGDADVGHTFIEGGAGGITGGVVFTAGSAGRAAAVVIGRAVRGGGDTAAITVDTIICTILGSQLRGGIVRPLHLRRGLLRDLDGGQGGAAVNQVGDQNHVAHIVGVQRVAQLQAVGIGGSGHADVSGNLGDGVGGFPVRAPAPGYESGAVRGVIHGRSGIVRGPGGVEHASRGVGGGKEVLDGYIIADVRTGIDGLSVGDAVCTAGVECIIIIPAVYR